MPAEAKRKASRRNSPDDPEEFRLALGDHLEELRDRLVRVLWLLLVGAVVGWFLQPTVYRQLSDLVRELLPKGAPYSEAFRSLTEPFFLKLKMAAFIGAILTLPLSVFQIWGFIRPGLKVTERRIVRLVFPISVLLFALGTFFGWIVLPSAFQWFVGYQAEFRDVQIIQEPGSLVFFILQMLLAFGLSFQLPIVVFVLAKVGVISAASLAQYWRHATVVIFFAAAALTPSSDPFSMMMLAAPLTILFFISVVAVRVSVKGERDPALDDLD